MGEVPWTDHGQPAALAAAQDMQPLGGQAPLQELEALVPEA